MRILATLAVVLGGLLIVGGLSCWGAAIWVVGPNSTRLDGTGLLLLITSVPLLGLGVTWLGDHS